MKLLPSKLEKDNPFFLFVFMFLLLVFSFSFNAFGQTEDCLVCHEDNSLTMERNNKEISLFINGEKFGKSAHGATSCGSCHADFDAENIPHKEGNNISKVECGTCHDKYANQLKTDIHHRLKERVGAKAPGCITCHGDHEVKKTSQIKNKTKEFCADCHTNITMTTPFHTMKYAPDDDCSSCHETDAFRENLLTSVHPSLSCGDCHLYEVKNFDLHQEGVPYLQVANCNTCHREEASQHLESIHGISLEEGINEAAACWDCHGSHQILRSTDAASPVNPKALPETCGKCHNDPEFIARYSLSIESPAKSYSESVHGKLLSSGEENVATCTSCHGVHDIKNRIQPGSKISGFNIPNSCEPCHSDITQEYKESIHWILAKKGVKFSPVCNDCHSEHSIHSINGGDRKMAIRKMQQNTCMTCHQSEILAERYGSNVTEVSQYLDSYHGLAGMRGDEDAAMCVDCHGVHKILPKNHPESFVSPEKVTETCRKCHPEANAIFSKSYSHVSQTEESRNVESIVTNLYFWLIVIVIGGMLLHNLLIFVYEIRLRRKHEKTLVRVPRFTQNEVVQHIILFSTFIILAITGFALKYPQSWWGEGLYSLGMSETVRQNTHRIAAVLMIILSFYHVYYLVFTKRGRDVLSGIFPKVSHLKSVIDNVAFYLRLRKEKPQFEQYDYAEKAEYWALVWGTGVMGLTGFVLWFPTLVGDWAPVWFIKVCEIIHFYEAILASLAILVWHWFFVIFHPGEYPMSFVWVDGKMNLHHYRNHHEKEFRKIAKEWSEIKVNKRKADDLSHFSKLFFDTLRKNEQDPDYVMQREIEHDPNLKSWLEEQLSSTETKS